MVVLFATVAAALLATLPPDGFFSSDEGVKFVQLRSLELSGFKSTAIAWPGRELGLDARWADTERFFELRDGVLYSPHPALFAAASAPGWLAFGFPGLYVLPLLAGVAVVALTALLARDFGVRRRWLAAGAVAFASPIFFYSLCLWEHVPAVALWLGGWAVLRRGTGGRFLLAGALWGLAGALRPEFYWLAGWSVAALAAFYSGRRLRATVLPAASFALVAVGVELLLWGIWGQPPFMRLASNLAYGGGRGAAAFAFAVGHSLVPFVPWYLGAAVAAFVALTLLALKWRPAAYVAAALGAGLAVLYAAFFGGHATPLAASFPAVFGLAFLAVSDVRTVVKRPDVRRRAFYLAAAGFAATLFVVIPDTSGFAWGPRFLLAVIPPAAIALAGAAEGGRGAGRVLRAGLIGLLLILSAGMQVFGFWRLKAGKESREELVAELRALPAAPILVNKWYLPPYAAPLYAERPFVIITDENQFPGLREELALRGVERVYFLTELPAAEGEREPYVLWLTTTLARDFDVADVRRIGAPGVRAYVLPYCLWTLRIGRRDVNT